MDISKFTSVARSILSNIEFLAAKNNHQQILQDKCRF